jgi:hypothetical protein
MTHETIWPVTDHEGRSWSVACRLYEAEGEHGRGVGLEVWPACHGTDRGEQSKVPFISVTYTEALVMGMLAVHEPIPEPDAGDDLMPLAAKCLLRDLEDKSPGLRQHLDEMWAGRTDHG